MNNTYPCINVCDIETSIQWYKDFPGFQCTYKSSIKSPDCALIEKDDLKIYMLKSDKRESYASNTLVIESHDLKADYTALENAGAIIVQSIGKGIFSDFQFVNKHPRPKGRGIHIIMSHQRKPVSRSFNLWILACARMTVFAASCGELNPQEIKDYEDNKIVYVQKT